MTDERFARHELIPDWRQSRLEGATVVVVGVGALGNEVRDVLGIAGGGIRPIFFLLARQEDP